MRLAVACHLHNWQNDLALLRATSVTVNDAERSVTRSYEIERSSVVIRSVNENVPVEYFATSSYLR